MANHGLTDFAATVTLPKSEYEELIRDSEVLNTARRFVTTNYATVRDIKSILGVEEGE